MYITICEIDDQSKFNAWKKNKTKQNKKIRTTKGTFNVMMGTIKDRNVMDRKEAKDIKKSWQEYTEELHKMILMTQITTIVWSLT